MSKQRLLILGATGETGASILEGLLEDGSFDVSLLIQPSSAHKISTQALRSRGIPIVICDLEGPVLVLVSQLKGFDTVISAINAENQLAQIPLVDAAKLAGVKRFVPCAFTTVCPPGGVMLLRDQKEVVYNHIFKHHLPYTIIDVGFWHQISFPRLPSGKSDYAALTPIEKIYGDGNAPNLLTDQRDVGTFVARIVKDERTLNKKVFTYSDELTSNEIYDIVEALSGEKLERDYIHSEKFGVLLKGAEDAHEADPNNSMKKRILYIMQYHHSKYFRIDNTAENAKYLGYLNARELYPDLKPIGFETFIGELLARKARKPYPTMNVS